MPPASTPSPWLHRFAVLTAIATFLLLGAGGLVTSHGVGMAVPDWPNTYGYNMFFFPPSRWVGGVFYEHTHRLWASAVGLLTTILALWLNGRKARPVLKWCGAALLGLALWAVFSAGHRADAIVLALAGTIALEVSSIWPLSEPCAVWLRRLGLLAFLAVVLQGVLGGLRVILFKDQIGIFHATLAQLFFALTCALALFTSRWWQSFVSHSAFRTPHSALATPSTLSPQPSTPLLPATSNLLSAMLVTTTLLILTQLVLGATMRHQHAGLAVPDFPLAYGTLWPATDAQSVALYNQHRLEVVAVKPITAFQIWLHMAHRALAFVILVGVTICAWRARRLERGHVLRRITAAWLVLIGLQVFLGALTVWSDKAADIATGHVMVGALSLAAGVLGSIVSLCTSVFASGFPAIIRLRQRVPSLGLEAAPAAAPGHQ